MDKFEQMVETIEEAEDMVECKECFDLFPKAECTKMDHGYICPTCGRGQQSQDFSDVSFTDITTDLYDQEFPDVREYDSEFGPEMEERQKDYHVDDIVDALIKDEYDAIESYELADEMIQEADIDEDMKDDLLDAIEHIREEEEEHIDEINKAAGRVEADPEDEDKKDDDSEEDSDSKDEDDDKDEDEDDKDFNKEDDDKDEDEDDKEKNESLTEAAPSPEIVEGEEILDEKKESVFDKIWKPVNESLWVCKFKDAEIGKVSAETEEEALEKMQKEFPEYNYGECDGCFEVIQEEVCKVHKGINHTEDEKEVLTEVFGGDKILDKFCDKGYIIKVMAQKGYPQPEGKYAKPFAAKTYKDAEKVAKQLSKTYTAGYAVCVYIKPLDNEVLQDLDPTVKKLLVSDASTKVGPMIAMFRSGKEETRYNKVNVIAKQLKTVAKTDKVIAKRVGEKEIELEDDEDTLSDTTDTDATIEDTDTVEDISDDTTDTSADDSGDTTDSADTDTETDTDSGDATEDTDVTDAASTEPAKPKQARTKQQVLYAKTKKMKGAIGKALLKGKGMDKAKVSQLINGLPDEAVIQLRKDLLGESLSLHEDFEDEVECAWCSRVFPKCECHKEVDMGWLCDGCERAINSRGETLTFEG